MFRLGEFGAVEDAFLSALGSRHGGVETQAGNACRQAERRLTQDRHLSVTSATPRSEVHVILVPLGWHDDRKGTWMTTSRATLKRSVLTAGVAAAALLLAACGSGESSSSTSSLGLLVVERLGRRPRRRGRRRSSTR